MRFTGFHNVHYSFVKYGVLFSTLRSQQSDEAVFSLCLSSLVQTATYVLDVGDFEVAQSVGCSCFVSRCYYFSSGYCSAFLLVTHGLSAGLGTGLVIRCRLLMPL